MKEYQEIRDTSPLGLKMLNDQLRLLWFKTKNANTKDIRDGAITGKKIEIESIDGEHIKPKSITTKHIKADFAMFADLQATNAKIDNLKVGTAQILDAAITNAKIGDAEIEGAKIANATIGTANIELGAITTALIEAGAIETAQIADASITDAKIVELTANKITSGVLSTERLIIRDPVNPKNSLIYEINNITGALQAVRGDTLNGEILTERSITADRIVAASITTEEIASKTILANNIASNAITADKIDANAITASKINVSSLSAISADIGEVTSGILRSADNTTWINLNNGSFSFENGAFTSGGIDISSPSNTYFVVRARYAVHESALSALQLKLVNEEHNAETTLQAGSLWFTINNTPRLQLGWNGSNNRAYFNMRDSNFSNSLGSQSLTFWSGSQQLSYYDKDGCAVEGPLWVDELYVSGEKSRVVKTRNYDEVLQYAVESPTPIFVDIGHGIIGEDGLCYVDIESMFSETIDLESDYHIQLTKYGEGDIWVEEKQNNCFIVEGTPNLKFAWEIKAKQKGYSNERLDRHSRIKEDEETDYASLADKYLMEYEKELIA